MKSKMTFFKEEHNFQYYAQRKRMPYTNKKKSHRVVE